MAEAKQQEQFERGSREQMRGKGRRPSSRSSRRSLGSVKFTPHFRRLRCELSNARDERSVVAELLRIGVLGFLYVRAHLHGYHQVFSLFPVAFRVPKIQFVFVDPELHRITNGQKHGM